MKVYITVRTKDYECITYEKYGLSFTEAADYVQKFLKSYEHKPFAELAIVVNRELVNYLSMDNKLLEYYIKYNEISPRSEIKYRVMIELG